MREKIANPSRSRESNILEEANKVSFVCGGIKYKKEL